MTTNPSDPEDNPPMNTPNPSPVRWLTPAEEAAWRNFLRLSRSMDRAIDRQLSRDSELSGSEYEILVPLSEAPEHTLMSRELLKRLGWERSRLSHMLSRMEKRGMIARSPSPTDGRGLMVSITDHGNAVVAEAAPAHVRMVREVFVDAMLPEELEAFTSATHKVLPLLEERDLI